MKKLLSLSLLAGAAFVLNTQAVQAQTAPNFPAPGSPARPATPATGDAARTRRQQQMTPEEAARDQQLQILEARTGNTSFGVEKGGPARQNDQAGNAFVVRKYKAMPGQEQKRGQTRYVPGAITHGKPLAHEHGRKKKFLFF